MAAPLGEMANRKLVGVALRLQTINVLQTHALLAGTVAAVVSVAAPGAD